MIFRAAFRRHSAGRAGFKRTSATFRLVLVPFNFPTFYVFFPKRLLPQYFQKSLTVQLLRVEPDRSDQLRKNGLTT